MTVGNFYFLDDQYFLDFPDPFLMRNKEVVSGVPHDRPCFFAFSESTSAVFWMIPFSSNVKKYRAVYNSKVARKGKCDTLEFGEVLGYEKAFLIQNMCPITDKYMKNEYLDSNAGIPVRLDGAFEKALIKKGKLVLALERRGVHLIFPDVLAIEKALLAT